MNTDTFHSQFLSTPWDSPRDIALRNAAMDYHERCEAYDRTVCTAVSIARPTVAMPANWEQSRAINLHARSVRWELASRLDATSYEFDAAIRATADRYRNSLSAHWDPTDYDPTA